MIKFGFVFTNYNNSEYTIEAVRSLCDCNTEHQYRVVVVDNNSSNESIDALRILKREFENFDLILNKENVGYFKGLNVGIRHLRSNYLDINHVIIGNNDLLFPSNYFDKLIINLSKFNNYAVISPDIVTLDGIHQNPHVIKQIGFIREVIYDLYYYNYYLSVTIRIFAKLTNLFTDRRDEEQYEIAQEIYQGHGSCYILGPIFFENYDELWAPSFLMGEEYFLSKMLSDKGLNILYEPTISVTHCCHVAMGKVPNKKIWGISREAHKIYRKYVKIYGGSGSVNDKNRI